MLSFKLHKTDKKAYKRMFARAKRSHLEVFLKRTETDYYFLNANQIQKLGGGSDRRRLGKKQIVNQARRQLARQKRTVEFAQQEAEAWDQFQEGLRARSETILEGFFTFPPYHSDRP